MTTLSPPKKNTAFTLPIQLPSQANTKIAQANPTLAAGDITTSVDGGANWTNVSYAIASGDNTVVILSFTTTQMNADYIIWKAHDVAGSEWCDVGGAIYTATNQFDDLALASALTTVAAAITALPATLLNTAITGYVTVSTWGAALNRLLSYLTSAPAVAGDEMNLVDNAITADSIQDGALTSAKFADDFGDAVAEIWAKPLSEIVADDGSIGGLLEWALDAKSSDSAQASDVSDRFDDVDSEIAAIPAAPTSVDVADTVWSYDVTTGAPGSILKWIYDRLDRSISSLLRVVLTPDSDITRINYIRPRGDEWIIDMTLGDLTDWTFIDIMLKADSSATDAAADLHVRLSNPGSGDDGLLRLNAETDGVTAAWGALVIDDESTGTTQLNVKANASVQLGATVVYRYEVQGRFSSGRAVRTLQGGTITVTEDIIRAIS